MKKVQNRSAEGICLFVSQVEMPNCSSGRQGSAGSAVIGGTVLHEESAELFRRRNLSVCIAGRNAQLFLRNTYMNIYTHIYTYIHIHTYKYTYIYTYIHINWRNGSARRSAELFRRKNLPICIAGRNA